MTELAAREHLTALTPVLEGALREADVTLRDIDAIAVTQGPGLIPALLVGLSFAKGLAMGNGIPYVGVNHFIGHIYGAFLDGAHEALEDPARLVLNGANEYTMKMAKRFPSALTAGAEGDVRAEKVTETEKGLRFFLTFKGERRFVEFPLHGKYNAYNAAMAAATALKLGVPLKDIAARLKLIRPVPHRFEVKREGEITVIDDGYNSNIEGALSSAESLKAFSGRKIVVAQGITELGKAKKRINARFADALAEAADMVVLVGENAGIIKKELGKRAFNGKIIRLRHFSEVEKTLAALLESGDVVWFQNDIP